MTTIHPGFSLQFADGRDDDHLHFVASSGKEPTFVLMSFTTVRRFSDESCVIEPGEHPFVVHRTCVAYQYANEFDTQLLIEMIDAGEVVPREPLSQELMLRVWDGAAKTKHLSLRCQAILKAQGVISDD